MNPLRRTPLFVALLVVLAAGGGTAGAVLGARTPPSRALSNTPGCDTDGDDPAVGLLPTRRFVTVAGTQYTSAASGTVRPRLAYRCVTSAGPAAVTVSVRPLDGTSPARFEARVADAGHLRRQDAVNLPVDGGTLVWPTAAAAHFTCGKGGNAREYGVEVHLTGAGRGTPARAKAIGDVVAEATQAQLTLSYCS